MARTQILCAEYLLPALQIALKEKSMPQETMHYQWWWEQIKAVRCYDVFTFDCKILCLDLTN